MPSLPSGPGAGGIAPLQGLFLRSWIFVHTYVQISGYLYIPYKQRIYSIHNPYLSWKPLPQRPSATNPYYNPLAVRVHPPVPASGVLHICTYVCTNNQKAPGVVNFEKMLKIRLS